MATKAFQKIYTKITQITKATCSLKATGVGYDELATVNGKLAQVAISSEGCLRRTGFTDGPPIGTSCPSISGPPSIGSPKALKKRPASCSLTFSVGDLPRNTTSALVGIPSVPSNTCKQMNYSKFKSEQYEGFQKQLKELVAERSVK